MTEAQVCALGKKQGDEVAQWQDRNSSSRQIFKCRFLHFAHTIQVLGPLLGLANTMFAPGDLGVFLQKLLLDLLARGVDRLRAERLCKPNVGFAVRGK